MGTEKISPPVKTINRSGGLKETSSASTITGPTQDLRSGWAKKTPKGSIMGKK